MKNGVNDAWLGSSHAVYLVLQKIWKDLVPCKLFLYMMLISQYTYFSGISTLKRKLEPFGIPFFLCCINALYPCIMKYFTNFCSDQFPTGKLRWLRFLLHLLWDAYFHRWRTPPSHFHPFHSEGNAVFYLPWWNFLLCMHFKLWSKQNESNAQAQSGSHFPSPNFPSFPFLFCFWVLLHFTPCSYEFRWVERHSEQNLVKNGPYYMAQSTHQN